MNPSNRQMERSVMLPLSTGKQPSRRERWSTLRQYLSIWLKRSLEVQVWQTRDRVGIVAWSAFDPTTGQRIHHASEEEIRRWIERRHLAQS